MVSYFAVALTIAVATHAWFVRRLVSVSRLPAAWTARLRWALFAHALVLPALLVLCLRAPASQAAWAVPLGRVAFTDEGFCLLLVVSLAAAELLRAIAGLGRAGRGAETAASNDEPDAGRRRALFAFRATGAAAVGVALGATALGRRRALGAARVEKVRLRLPGLAPGLSGLRIVQISDLHVGPTLRRDTVEAVVDQVRALAPELVVLTGDLVDGFVDQLRAEVAPLAQLRAPLGQFFVTGNHEYFYRAEEWTRHVSELGWTVLLNDHRAIDRGGARLLLAGVCDESGGAHVAAHAQDLGGALAGAPACDARILLAHRPDCAPRAAALGFDVQLSGHLHGGQCFPLTTLLDATLPYVAGLYRVSAMHLYLNRGAGYWGPPLRLGAPQEITLFELVA